VFALAATGPMCIGLSAPAFRNDAREAEFYALLLFALLGAIVLAGAGDVMEILLGVLLTSVGSYALVAYRRTSPPALEALLKYYLFAST
jgi:NADH-quinone oxidoreductase subunit N